jgi:hypothetical protein
VHNKYLIWSRLRTLSAGITLPSKKCTWLQQRRILAVDRIRACSVAWPSWGGDGRWTGSRGASFQRTGLATKAVCHCGARSGVSSPQSRAPGLLGGMAPNDVLWRCRFGRRTRPQAGIDSGWEMLRPFSWRLVCVEASQQAVEEVGEAG